MAQVETEKRRFAILDHLNKTPSYELNEEILKMGAQAQGIPTTRDQMRTALGWLAEQELIKLSYYGELALAKLTVDGQEVAASTRVVPGITRPGPGA